MGYRKDTEYERYAAGDQAEDGRPSRAFLRTTVGDRWGQKLKVRGGRIVLLLDGQSRIARIFTEARAEERWVARLISDWKYAVPVDRSPFEPRFPADVRVVDANAAFERHVDLDKAIHREERQGLWYAIHHDKRFENGGLFAGGLHWDDPCPAPRPQTVRQSSPN